LAVVLVGYGVDSAIVTLFDVVHLDVGALVDSSEKLVVFCKGVAHDLKMLIFIIDDGHTLFRVVSDDHLNNIQISVDECPQS
jgi:hypothetical protein